MAGQIEGADVDRVHRILRTTEKSDESPASSRAKPMRVLCLGMGRTGTTSLAAALKLLGYTPYDFIDRFYREHFHIWDSAIRAKFLHAGDPWGRTDFDQVTSDFDAVLDIPCCLFVDELITAYPDAKVILNVRDDPDKWVRSMQKTLFTVFDWPSWKILQYTEPRLCGRWFTHVNLIMQVFCSNDRDQLCKQKYIEHNQHVRAIVPPDRLLEWQVKDGWDPICDFLSLEVPAVEFPKGNAPQEFLDTHTKLWKVAIYLSVKRVCRLLLPAGMVLGLAWAWWRWQS